MAKASPEPIGNENSYSPEFFEELYEMLRVFRRRKRRALKQAILNSAQAYMYYFDAYHHELPPSEIKKELKKSHSNIQKAGESIGSVIGSGNYGDHIVESLHNVISEKYPSLHSLLPHIKKDYFGTIYSPASSLALLSAMQDGIQKTLDNLPERKTTPRSDALNEWVMALSVTLEQIIRRRLEQARYYKTDKGGEYISKRKMSDSELLYFIIEPLDSNVTISQLETAIKETREQRLSSHKIDFFAF